MVAHRRPGELRFWRMIKSLPNCRGVYAVFAGERLLYIGKTRGIYVRIRQHHLRDKFIEMKADHVEYIECGSVESGLMEGWLIAKHNPPLNTARVLAPGRW